MSNRNANRVNRDLETEGQRVGNQYDQYTNSREGFGAAARDRSDQVYNEAMPRYTRFLDELGPSGMGGGGGRSGEARSGYRRYATGGGVTDENKARIRGNGVFDEFSRTGGYSEADKANIRARGTRTIPSFFDGLRTVMNQQQSANPYGNAGYNAQFAQMTRDQAQQAQEAAQDAEFGIMDRVNEGRKWGSSSVSDAERALVDAVQRGEMFGIEGLSREDSLDTDNSYRNRALYLEGLGGLRGLRTDTPGEVNMYENAVQGGMGAGAGARRGILNDRMQYNPNRSFAERISPYLNMAAGAAGAFAGGGTGGGGGFGNFLRNRRNTGIGGMRVTPGTSSAGPGFFGVS